MLHQGLLIRGFAGMLALSLLFYGTGLAFNYLVNRGRVYTGWLATYFYLLCGMLLVVGGTAVYFTRGASIMSFVFPLTCGLAYIASRHVVFRNASASRERWSPVLFYLLSLSAAFAYYACGFWGSGGQLRYVWGDQEFYSRIASCLKDTGIENMRIEYLYPRRFAPEPYHFGDIWTMVLAHQVSGLMPVYSGILCSGPLLMAIGSLGAASVLQHFFPAGKNTVIYFLCIGVGFVGGFQLLFPAFLFPASVDVYAPALANYTKLLWWGALLPVLFMLILSEKDEYLIWPAGIIGLSYLNVLPGLMIGLALWSLIQGVSRREFRRYAIHFTAGTMAILACFLLLYKVYPKVWGFHSETKSIAVLSAKVILNNLKTSVHIFIGGLLQLSVYLPPLALLVVSCLAEKVRINQHPLFRVCLFGLVVISGGLLTWAMLFTATVEAVQFFYNVFVVISGFLSAIIYLYLLAQAKGKAVKIASVALLLWAMAGNLHYQANVGRMAVKEKEALFSFIGRYGFDGRFAHYRNTADYTASFFSANTVVNIPYSILNDKIKGYTNYSLNVGFALPDSASRAYPFQMAGIAWAPVSHYISQQQAEHWTSEEIMFRFMSDYQIDFLTLPENVALPEVFRSLTDDSLHTPGEGWKIYHCHYPATNFSGKNSL